MDSVPEFQDVQAYFTPKSSYFLEFLHVSWIMGRSAASTKHLGKSCFAPSPSVTRDARTPPAQMCQMPDQGEKTDVVVEIKNESRPGGRRPGYSLVFSAIAGVMLRAKRATLEPTDLLELHASDEVLRNAEIFQVAWVRELARHAQLKAAGAQGGKKKVPKLPSLSRAVWPQLRGLWRVAVLCYAISIGMSFIGPLLLSYTVRVLEQTQICGVKEQLEQDKLALPANSTFDGSELFSALASNTRPHISAACREANKLHRGYIYAAAMLVAKITEAIFNSWHTHLMVRLALRARAAIITTIYRKCLWLSGTGGDGTTTGRIQNLMANDAQGFVAFAPMVNNIIAAPIQITVAFAWLATIIGPSFLAVRMRPVALGSAAHAARLGHHPASAARPTLPAIGTRWLSPLAPSLAPIPGPHPWLPPLAPTSRCSASHRVAACRRPHASHRGSPF